MGTDRRRFFLSFAAAALLALPAAAYAQQNKSAIEVPMRDPWVPPAVADKAILAPETQGEALRAQVRAKLKRRFDAAASPDGTLTAAQARSAGLGAIADRFEAIDRAGRGAIRFEDYERFLELRR
ncbi:MAG TPA: hypothetical protein VFV90_11040 [Usitatibacter sp.]|nr:hypothetical protein [Usitatibacter sp.]